MSALRAWARSSIWFYKDVGPDGPAVGVTSVLSSVIDRVLCGLVEIYIPVLGFSRSDFRAVRPGIFIAPGRAN